ncbi:hypothetical protein [Pseudoroseicyclus tamaricis]|uniref:Uncharacterized protein n=1 Tax=Pseudoroseicyclus tamaricis TaxID=2705421 RepID=A0A6B2JRH1_9RHOB|nr:hypothetical protein [Pseudoroseicyclus tamaricis]NDV00778.1 hypothetical protein [Pseudoroseicyclus tamaricis]
MRLLIAAASLCLALPAAAQDAPEVIGTAVIEGQDVELLSDGSWRPLVEEAPAARAAAPEITEGPCAPVTETLAFCGAPESLTAMDPAGTAFTGVWRPTGGSDITFGLMAETAGLSRGVTLEDFVRLVVETAETGAGIDEEILGFRRALEGETLGHPSTTLAYRMPQGPGGTLGFVNTLVMTEDEAIQLLAWQPGPEPTDGLLDAQQAFAALFRPAEDAR